MKSPYPWLLKRMKNNIKKDYYVGKFYFIK